MESSSRSVRVRFAPSPTGELHLGGARTALYNYLFARKHKGVMVLRIEDTDQKRYVAGSMERFLEDLAWLGIEITEGPEQGGQFAPYIQSERTARHQEIAHQLVERGAAYYEFETLVEGSSHNDEEYKAGRMVYRGGDRELSLEEAKARVAANESYIVRLKVPNQGMITVHDLVRGEVSFDLSTIDDAVLLKSDGMATYHLAAMVDDYDMQISHVFRSEEWLPSIPKHLLIYQAMTWELPQFAHLPILLAEDRKKLSKRIHGEAVWIRTYRDQGYLPSALVNYLALLGWNPGGNDEFFELDQLIVQFSLERVHKAGAIIDLTKLDAFQRHYVQALSLDELIELVSPFCVQPIEADLLRRLVTITQNRIGKLSEFSELVSYLLSLPVYESALLVFRKSTPAATRLGLESALAALEAASETVWSDEQQLAELLDTVVVSRQLSNGDVFWPVRMSLTGQERSPSPAECLWALGRQESLRRLQLAMQQLSL